MGIQFIFKQGAQSCRSSDETIAAGNCAWQHSDFRLS